MPDFEREFCGPFQRVDIFARGRSEDSSHVLLWPENDLSARG